ncbi:SDR family NAD(P)-dependent oxidoreductase [Rhodovulum sp. DZ06]|uniref:SDR family NAD(P)-dependent oxidoreductase n=1 Tax=Rhodovulum sp. DZ06 TaxID=3425126 RepID=UPI003D32E500
MPKGLEGRVAIVTGAGGGVGRATARRLAAEGAKVLIADRDEAELRSVAVEIEDDGGEAIAFPCDVTEPLTASNIVASALDAWDRIDILVNGARQVIPGAMMETDHDALAQTFDVNVRATFRLSQAVAKRMIAQSEEPDFDGRPPGTIINISSIAARRTLPELLTYSVGCAALDQLTRSMAVALAPYKIRVNAVALGSVMTRNLREALRDHTSLRAELTKVTPLGRVGESGEAAEAALFLVSDKASFITGQILAVDGGRTTLDPLATPAL